MIAVTGMHRSGTSCVAGLLERCGFSLGTSHPLLTIPCAENSKGHFENRSVVALNDAVLKKAGGCWYRPPSPEALDCVGERFAAEFTAFDKTFNGDIFKDPRTCLTISLWEKFCPRLEALVLCLRNPVAVAGSLKRRNDLSIEQGLELWYEYNLSFILGTEHLPVYVVDYDNLETGLELELTSLCADLGRPIDTGQMRKSIGDFYAPVLDHGARRRDIVALLPERIARLYEIILSQTYSRRVKQQVRAAV